MKRMTPRPIRALIYAALLTGIVGFADSAFAQTGFTFSTGYNTNSTGQGLLPTLNVNGSAPSGEVNYSNFDSGATSDSGSGNSSTAAIYSGRNGRDIEEDSSLSGAPFRILQGGFYVPAGQSVTLTSVTFDVYVLNATSNPFTNSGGTLTGKGFFQVFNNAPTSNGIRYSGDFTTNLLTTTPTLVGYRIPDGTATTSTARPLYRVTLDLTKMSGAIPLTGASGPYYFGVSMNKDAGAPNDVNFPLANATDAATGQPGGTSGDGIIYDSFNGYRPDAPAGDNVVDGFAMTFTGSIVSASAPEPGSFQFVGIGVPGMFGTIGVLGMIARRRRKAQSA